MQNNIPTKDDPYSPIPVIHELTRVYTILHNAIRDFPKQEKFSIGEMMEKILLECIESCFLGTTMPPGSYKLHHIATASAKFDALKLFIRVSVDIHCMKEQTYTKLIPILGEIGKMLGGWLNSAKKGVQKQSLIQNQNQT